MRNMLDSLIPAKKAPVVKRSVSQRCRIASTGCMSSRSATSDRFMPRNRLFSGAVVEPMVMPCQSSSGREVDQFRHAVCARDCGVRQSFAGSLHVRPRRPSPGKTTSSSVAPAGVGIAVGGDLQSGIARRADQGKAPSSSLLQLLRPAVLRWDISTRMPVVLPMQMASSIASRSRSPSLRMWLV